MVYEFRINNRLVKTGDIISTRDGTNSIYSIGFLALSGVIPGEADHSVLYVGPGGLCVEAGIHGVITFTAGNWWNSEEMYLERGLLDTFMAASSVLANRGMPAKEETAARRRIRAFAMGCVGRPYNIDFFNPDTIGAFYCSQLVYLAYKHVGIDLNTGGAGLAGRLCERVIFPQEIYDNSVPIVEE